MRVVKKYLLQSVLLIMYIFAVALLSRYFYVYQQAYQGLSRLISHPSIETVHVIEETEEE